MRDITKPALLVVLLASACGVSENPEYCEDHGACAANPAGSFCHPAKHYCYRGCSSDQECQDPASPAYLAADRPVCSGVTHECEGTLALPGARDAGPARDGHAPASELGPGAELGPAGKKPRGASCGGAAECASGFCADGVCCDGTCDGTCLACDLPGSVGTCAPVPAGADPAKECAGSGGACAGSCDGNGACSFAASKGQGCASSSCAAGALTVSACDAKGACVTTTQACGGYACVGATACKASCASSSDCTAGFSCVAGACVSQLPLGAACGKNDEACASKHCSDGACCKVASCGACRQCGAGGECLPANEGGSCGGTSCSGSAASGAAQTLPLCKAGACATTTKPCGDYLCDAAGSACLAACTSDGQCKASAYCAGAKCQPKKPLGQTCSAAKECQSGACVDGVCCDGACAGTCMSCKLPGSLGQCKAIPDGQNPDAECAGSAAACSGTCDGKGACRFPGPTTACKPSVCVGTMLQHFSCYKGDCFEHGASCTGDYLCASATACGTSCSSGAQCVTGYCDQSDLFGRKNTCGKLDEVCYADAKVCPAKGAGTQAVPFCKIQDCLDTKRPYVLVADGSYHENLIIKADVQLVAPGSSAPLVDARSGAVNTSAIKAELVPTQSSSVGISIADVGKVLLRGFRVTYHGSPTTASGDLVRLSAFAGTAGSLEVRIASCDLFEARPFKSVKTASLAVVSGSALPVKLVVEDTALTGSPYGLLATATSTSARPKLTLNRVVAALNTDAALALTSVDATVSDAFIAFNPGRGVSAAGSTLVVERAKVGANGMHGLYLDGSTAHVANSLVNDNGAEGIRLSGSGTLLSGANLELVNVTAANNKVAELSCPAWTSGTGVILVENSILYGAASSIVAALACQVTVEHSAVKNLGGGTNTAADPKFAGGALDPYRLQLASPCVDAGSDAKAQGSLDVNGQPRLVGKKLGGTSKVDLGAYELQ